MTEITPWVSTYCGVLILVFIFLVEFLQVLVMAPTRELAIQVAKDFKDISKKLVVTCFYGGSSYNPQSAYGATFDNISGCKSE